MQATPSIKLAALLLAAALFLCACTNNAQISSEDASVILPNPTAAGTRQILGETSADNTYEVTLHFASDNSLSLGSVTRSLQIFPGDNLIESVLSEVLDSASLSGSVEADVLNIENGSGVATVNLSIEAGVNRSEQNYLLLCASIANTLLEMDGIDAVNILTGNRSDPLCSLPTGAFVDVQDNVAALYAQVQTESDHFPGDDGSSITRNVLLYFPADGGRFLLPEVRELRFDNDNYLSVILEALSAGPLMRSCSFSPIPAGSELLVETPQIQVTPAGERIAELDFSSMMNNYLSFAGIEPWQLYGSIVLSLCSFIPELDAVHFYTDGVSVNECILPDRTLHASNGLMRRTDFSSAVGSSASLYLSKGKNELRRIEYPLSRAASLSPLDLLAALIEADTGTENSPKLFPQGISEVDILGVSVENRIASVNLSGNFYSRCQNLNAAEERLLIYAMVNTITELPGISAVSFLVEGEQADSLAQNIYLKTALFPDYGLVSASIPTDAGEIVLP